MLDWANTASWITKAKQLADSESQSLALEYYEIQVKICYKAKYAYI